MIEFNQIERLQLYRLLIEQTNVNSGTRRDTARFFLTFNTGAFTLVGLAVSNHWLDDLLSNNSLIARVALAGMAVLMAMVCVLWILLTRYYGSISSAKFEVILDLEKQFEIQPFAKENAIVWTKRASWLSASFLESCIPLIFILGYLGLGVVIIAGGWFQQ